MPRPDAKVSVRASVSLLELEPIICISCTFLAAEEVTSSTAFPLEPERGRAGERGQRAEERGARESESERGSKVLSWQEAVNRLFHGCGVPVCLPAGVFLSLSRTGTHSISDSTSTTRSISSSSMSSRMTSPWTPCPILSKETSSLCSVIVNHL